ncbi:methylmalonyl-CoA epimerase, mitochondrial isoform X2 [Lathamus discolor]|uniref:methylmalonyl-CoA epimerase, mitochondrial isoform X2 n=1 Tax=Lathamus discolor TaxID=678569 RepID=UPI0032B76AE5
MAASLGRAVAGLLSRLQTSATTTRTLLPSSSCSQNIPSCLWKLGRLNHVAIAVPDLEKAQSLYKDVLGAQERRVPLQAFCKKTRPEECTISALRSESCKLYYFMQSVIIKSNGITEVDDIKAAMTELKKKKIRILSEEPKIGAHGKPVIFLHPKDCHGVLVELEQA